mmetsp:Transcript_47115/g.124110  ORF Transcript_47115/g.124110 Transcript_47115/m.124110 type:complete len:335 (+) Transcript_47115:61-1065(+)
MSVARYRYRTYRHIALEFGWRQAGTAGPICPSRANRSQIQHPRPLSDVRRLPHRTPPPACARMQGGCASDRNCRATHPAAAPRPVIATLTMPCCVFGTAGTATTAHPRSRVASARQAVQPHGIRSWPFFTRGPSTAWHTDPTVRRTAAAASAQRPESCASAQATQQVQTTTRSMPHVCLIRLGRPHGEGLRRPTRSVTEAAARRCAPCHRRSSPQCTPGAAETTARGIPRPRGHSAQAGHIGPSVSSTAMADSCFPKFRRTVSATALPRYTTVVTLRRLSRHLLTEARQYPWAVPVRVAARGTLSSAGAPPRRPSARLDSSGLVLSNCAVSKGS